MKPRMDPLDDAPRCVHDMLILAGKSTCAICKGLPDVPDLDIASVDEGATRRLRWVTCEVRSDCTRCGARLQLGQRVAYSYADQGVIGECCETAA